MGRSLKKGPFIDGHLLKKVEDYEHFRQKTGYQNVVSSFYDLPAIHWSHISEYMMDVNTCLCM